jgi:hypothetical protein
MTRVALLAALALLGCASGCFGGDDDDGADAGSGSTKTTTRVEVIDGLGDDGEGFDPQRI